MRRDVEGNIASKFWWAAARPCPGHRAGDPRLPALADLLSYSKRFCGSTRYGRRDNIHKARIKGIGQILGAAQFRDEVEAEWRAARADAPHLAQAEVERVRAFFTIPYESLADTDATAHREPEFRAWHRYNTARIVCRLSRRLRILKAHGRPPGNDFRADAALATLASK